MDGAHINPWPRPPDPSVALTEKVLIPQLDLSFQSQSFCPYCRNTKKAMCGKGIPLVVVELDNRADGQLMQVRLLPHLPPFALTRPPARHPLPRPVLTRSMPTHAEALGASPGNRRYHTGRSVAPEVAPSPTAATRVRCLFVSLSLIFLLYV